MDRVRVQKKRDTEIRGKRDMERERERERENERESECEGKIEREREVLGDVRDKATILRYLLFVIFFCNILRVLLSDHWQILKHIYK